MPDDFHRLKLRTAVLLARSREARARASRILQHARLLRAISAGLFSATDEMRRTPGGAPPSNGPGK